MFERLVVDGMMKEERNVVGFARLFGSGSPASLHSRAFLAQKESRGQGAYHIGAMTNGSDGSEEVATSSHYLHELKLSTRAVRSIPLASTKLIIILVVAFIKSSLIL